MEVQMVVWIDEIEIQIQIHDGSDVDEWVELEDVAGETENPECHDVITRRISSTKSSTARDATHETSTTRQRLTWKYIKIVY